MKHLLLFCLLVLGIAQRSFIIKDDEFVKDGSVFHIFSGEIHYSRVPPTYWQDRILRLKAIGLNAVQIYVPWNFHEENQGEYDFTGWRDIGAFLATAQQADMLVLLRAGPYMCGEWEFGGFPAWLLSLQPPITIRTYEQGYIDQVDKWWAVLFNEVQPYLYENGGPIVMVQMENEYGSYGDVQTNPSDKQYMEHLVDLARQYLGNNVILYTTDGGDVSYMAKGTLVSEVYSVGDFGPGSDPTTSFNAQKMFNDPGMSPNMCSEYYTGWLTHWSEQMANTSSQEVATWLQKILQLDGSFSLYMGHGGSNFGFWSGANGGGTSFQPHITSYDYDSPISEGGEHGYGPDGDKFVAVKNALAPFLTQTPPPEPTAIVKANYPSISLNLRADFWDSLSVLIPQNQTFQSQKPTTMEAFGGKYGFIMYSTKTPSTTQASNKLAISDYVRDRAIIYINREEEAVIYRPDSQTASNVAALANDALDILVENMGRINYGHGMWDAKGISEDVTWNGVSLSTSSSSWSISLIPLQWQQIVMLNFTNRGSAYKGPGFYRGTLNIAGEPHDTYIKLENWVKGIVWINSNNIGRYWETEGPQHTLYIPNVFLQTGANDVVVFELHQADNESLVSFVNAPQWYTGVACSFDQKAVDTDNVVIDTCNSAYDLNQLWTVQSDNTVSLKQDSTLCLQEGPGSDPSSGYPNVQLAACTGSKEQQFVYNSSSGAFKNAANGQCIDVTNGYSNDGNNVETYPCTGGNNQKWTINSNGQLISAMNNKSCISVCPVSELKNTKYYKNRFNQKKEMSSLITKAPKFAGDTRRGVEAEE